LRIAQEGKIEVIYFAIVVQIAVFDIAAFWGYTRTAEYLRWRVACFLVINKNAFGNITVTTADRLAYKMPPWLR
jgi:hypothetical protein